MIAGVQFTSILLVCLLVELDYCTAFPRARKLAYSEEQLEGRVTGQPNEPMRKGRDNRAQLKKWLRPQGRSAKGGSFFQMENLPSEYDQTGGMQSAPITWPEVSPPGPNPINFVSNMEVPFANGWGQNTGSDWNQGESNGYGPEFYIPTRVIDNGFIPSDGDFDPNGENVYRVSLPRFQTGIAIPVPLKTHPSEPFNGNGFSENGPENGFEPGQAVQQMTDQIYDPVYSKTDYVMSPIEPVREYEIPTENGPVFPAPTWPISQYRDPPQQVFTEFYSAQINPKIVSNGRYQSTPPEIPNVQLSWFPSHHEFPGNFLNEGQQTGSQYVLPQPWNLDAAPYGKFIPSFDWSNVQTIPFLSSLQSLPDASQVHDGLPSFGHNKPHASTTNYVMGNVMQVGHNNYSSSYPLQYSIGGPSAPDSVPRLTAFAPVENYQGFSTGPQTQIIVPEVDIFTEDGNPLYLEPFIDVGEMPEYPFTEQIVFPVKN